jgi:glycosyltransferase involved in cell wall biosynthesis
MKATMTRKRKLPTSSPDLAKTRIAIVIDWLVTSAGAELVLAHILTCFPHADLYCLIDFLPEAERGWLQGKQPRTTFMQHIPFVRKHYTKMLPLMTIAIESLDLSGYDIILSSSHAVAKGVIKGPHQLHISYVHSPMRYAWDMQFQYLKQSGKEHGIKRLWMIWMLQKMRLWDVRSAHGVDHFLTNSHFTRGRIHACYQRDALVLSPPVRIAEEAYAGKREDFYLIASRLVPYKRIDLVVKAFARMPCRRLVVIGDGPEYHKIKRLAGTNVTIMGFQPDAVLHDHMRRAQAFIFAALEDFGSINIEVQGHGTPVIAYGKGGSCETVVAGATGLFFHEQTVAAVIEAVDRFEKNKKEYTVKACRTQAEKFAPELFHRKLVHFVDTTWQEHLAGRYDPNKQL